jgi:hypothetical protein
MQEAVMSKHSRDPKFSPLLWLIPVPFILASFLPLTIDHPVPAKPQQMAAATDSDTADSATANNAASSPRLPHTAD